jgi:ammonia channel protein AmtB
MDVPLRFLTVMLMCVSIGMKERGNLREKSVLNMFMTTD